MLAVYRGGEYDGGGGLEIMAKTSRKCKRCGRRDTKAGQTVAGYGNVCPPCFKLCAFPVEEVAAGLAALITGAIPLPLGFISYREIREMREREEHNKAIREESARIEAQRQRRERLAALKSRLGRLPRADRKALAARIRREEGASV
jgi:recombinational DNA repair protein (RecF pathway)